MPKQVFVGCTFPDNLADKAKEAGLFPEIPRDVDFDVFYADGHPRCYTSGVLYPCFTAHYLQLPIPDTFLNFAPGYRRRAAVAARKWLEKELGVVEKSSRHTKSMTLMGEISGQVETIEFPLDLLQDANGVVCACLPFPDIRENEVDWEDGGLPNYAEVQARFLLWCMGEAEVSPRPACVRIVRITGNTPGDVTIRTIWPDAKRDEQIARQVFRAVQDIRSDDLVASPKMLKRQTWFEAKEEALEDAFAIENEAFSALVERYMAVKSERLELKRKSDGLKERMDALAIEIATLLPKDALSGSVTDADGKIYTVTNKKARATTPSISADLIRQFHPELGSQVITYNLTERGRVDIGTF